MTTSSYFTSLFGRSPVRPLQEHMSKVYACVCELEPLLQAVVKEDFDKVEQIQMRITELEHDADEMKKELRHHLPKGLFMPIDRRDLLEVLLMQDAMANQTKDIAGLILGRKMKLPEQTHQLFIEYCQRCISASHKALQIINELDELVETGFRGLQVDRVEEMIHELDVLESDTDTIQVDLRAIILTLENELKAVDVMFVYRLIEWIGMVADHAQRVGSRLQLVLAK